VTLSTLPVRWEMCTRHELALARRRLGEVAHALARLSWETGVTVRLAVEPEPCCAVETTADLLALFDLDGGLDDVAREHLGACLDLCHACVEHEDPLESLARYDAAGVRVFKIQVSAALEVPDPADPQQRERLAQFVEPRWLHQVGRGPGDVLADLPDALSAASSSSADGGPWRVHFHVPLHAAEVGGLPTTRATVERVLRHVATLAHPPVLELETYTWSVVPGASDDLAANVARELVWAHHVLAGAVEA
jgi:sugar phosphate isomerase/epimerase